MSTFRTLGLMLAAMFGVIVCVGIVVVLTVFALTMLAAFVSIFAVF